MSVISSATSIGSIGSINSVGGSKKRRAPVAPSAQHKRPLPRNAIPEETPSLLRTEEEVVKENAQVGDVKYLRSQSEGRGKIMSECDDAGYINRNMEGRAESVSRVQERE